MKQKGFTELMLVVLILAIALAAGGAYYLKTHKRSLQDILSQQPIIWPIQNTEQNSKPIPDTFPQDTTTDWKTYYGYLFFIKLPNGWKDISSTISFFQYINYDLGQGDGEFDPKKDKGKLKVEIYVKSTDLSLKEFVAREKEDQGLGMWGKGKWEEKEITIDSQPAIKIIDNGPGQAIYVSSPTKDVVYTISFTLDFDNSPELADQILSTFKFRR